MTRRRTLASLARTLFQTKSRRSRRLRSSRIAVEPLERRQMLTGYTVTTPLDNIALDGQITFREAVLAANTNLPVGDAVAGQADGDRIRFAATAGTITLALGELAITDDVVIGGTQEVTIDAAGMSRIFNVTSAENVTLVNLDLRNGAVADAGGAIAASGGGLTMLSRVSITNSTAGGAGGGAISVTSSRLTVFDSDIVENRAGGAAGSGGGILNGAGGTLFVQNSRILNNTANRAGGGIEDNSGEGFGTSLIDVILNSNNAGVAPAAAAPGNGGALHVTGTGAVFIRGSLVIGNRAALEGGGLWSGGGVMKVVDTRISGNTAAGAAADDGGGGIFNNGGRLTLSDSQVVGNSATGAAGSGGGIFSTAGFVFATRTRIAGNVANRAGGGVELIAGNLSLQQTTLAANTAGPAASAAPGNGGGLHVTAAARVLIEGGAVADNTAALEGGGLWNSATGRLAVRLARISGNTASGDAADDGGGGIFNNGGKLSLHRTTVIGNTADGASGSGGGIFSASGNVSITDSSIDGNTANRAGGGIEVVDGNVTLNASGLVRNVAGPDGSAAPGNGGALHVSGTNGTVVRLEVSGVALNRAAGEGGGLWNQAGSTLIVIDSSINRNIARGTAAGDGGGIFDNGGTLTVERSVLYENRAGGSGGAVAISAGGTARFSQSQILRNFANRVGGGIYNNGSLRVAVESGISNNMARINGGGVFTDAEGMTDLVMTQLFGNTPNNTAGPGSTTGA